ncbi:MAG: hypothetical protein HKP17_09585 [Ignavibacteriaceae bacterium]|nr:metallophosphoesterase [Ignavibacteria bacterium]NNJ53411.1 hypothetical protein [Ignavibacteriaceae bacterium]
MKFILLKITLYLFFALTVKGQSIFWNSLESSFKLNLITHRLILIGDAGEPAKDIKEPVLVALEKYASFNPDSTLIVFLGDNIYPNGLPNENESGREEYERRLKEQIDAIVNSNAYGVFIPGNHDWKRGSEGGWERIKNQANFILNYGYNKVIFSPSNGCPGPTVFDFSDNIRLIVLDTQWWFQDKDERPGKLDKLCEQWSDETILTALDSILQSSINMQVVIAAHHPLKTYGPHGGYFGWKDHIFPLRNLNDALWIPLPIIGSLYPLVRGSGVSNQDLPNSEYQKLKNDLESILSKYSGIVYASGHEHVLQILDGDHENIYVVSGSGIWGHVEESLSEGDDTIFSGQHEGFIVLDFISNGKMELKAIKVTDERGNSQQVFSMWLN